MATLACLGLGYSAQHYVAQFGARFDRIIGTARSPERVAELGQRDFGGRRLEMLAFAGTPASPALRAAIEATDALLISAAPDAHGDPVLAALGDALLAAPRLSTIVLLSTVGVYGDHGGGWVDETTACDPARARASASRRRPPGMRSAAAETPRLRCCGSPASMGRAAMRSSICATARRATSPSPARCSTASMSPTSRWRSRPRSRKRPKACST